MDDIRTLWAKAADNMGIKFAKRGTVEYQKVRDEFAKLRILAQKQMEIDASTEKIKLAKSRKLMCKMERENLRIQELAKKMEKNSPPPVPESAKPMSSTMNVGGVLYIR